MKRKILLKRKAVVASLLMSFIICSASTTIPAIQGSKITDIIDNKVDMFSTQKNDYSVHNLYAKIQNQEDVSYEEVFSFLKKNLAIENNNIMLLLLSRLDNNIKKYIGNQFLEDFPVLFKKTMKFIDSPDMTRQELCHVLFEKIIPMQKEIGGIVTGKKSMSEMSPDSQNILERIGDNLNEEDLVLNSDNNDYWQKYEQCLEIWGYLNTNNFEDWKSQANWVTTVVMPLINIALLTLAFAMAITRVSLITWIVAAAMFLGNYIVIGNFANSFNAFYDVVAMETGITLHIVDKAGLGINGLGNCDLTSLDAEENLDFNKWGLGIDDFTYTLQPAVNNDSGWYELCSKTDMKYKQPPPPPGMWEVYIPSQELPSQLKYEEFTFSISDIQSGTTQIETITLESNPNIPVTPLGPTCLKVGAKGTYSVFSGDPDGGQMKYKFDWDADGSHVYSDWNDYNDSGVPVNITNSWDSPGTYVVKARAKDDQQEESGWSDGLIVYVSS